MQGWKKFVSIVSVGILLVCMFDGCSKSKMHSTIHIATKPMTEQMILGEMLKILIEDKLDADVEITQGVGGGTANIQTGLLNGEFDLYPEYTGTSWLYVLKKTEIPDNETLFEELQKEYEEEFGLKWEGLYGFNNTFRLLVRREVADKYHLKTTSDLAKVADQLTFGAGYDYFEREDGYDALCGAYQMEFGEIVEMDSGLKYTALNEQKVDVITVYTTDAQITVADAVVMEDDLHFFEDYFCGTVIRSEVLEENPGLEEVLLTMDGLISDEEMSELNYAVEIEKRDAIEVAKEFLQKKGLR